MPMDRFYIGYVNNDSGLQSDLKPYAIPDEAFKQLDNAYVFRGRVRKRFGSTWLGNTQESTRFRVAIGTTAAVTGNFAGFVPLIGGVPIVTPAIGQMFSIGTTIFTVNALGNPATLLTTGAATGTFDTTTGAVTITGNATNPLTTVYYYPALPVMGLLTFNLDPINDEPIIGFDTRFAYQYILGGWERLNLETTANAARWLGSDSQFFWGTTWTTDGFNNVFFVTNFNENELNFMRFMPAATLTWDNFRPAITAAIFLNSARILVPFKNRLLAFNTWEGAAAPGDNYTNRVRYSQIGSPLDPLGWRQDIPGRGNAIDCPTTEDIVTVEFVKDRLIVFFERSTWELVYTGNQVYPFVWQQINTELGAESTFAIVPFDKVCIGVGNVGIHACNGSNVERIDQKIPQEIFKIHNLDDGVFRVYGIRDYFVEMVYWTFPGVNNTPDFHFPNKVLVYNYKTGTWAFNDDSITAFGYWQPTAAEAINWDSTTITWDDEEPWDSGQLQGAARKVIAGNQEGWTFICDPDVSTNAPALQITDITVAAGNVVTIRAINHNLRVGDFVYLQDITGTGNLTLLNNKIFKIVIDPLVAGTPNIFTFVYPDPSVVLAGVYSGGGTIARVSKIDIKTKEYNFYANKGRNAYISKVDFMVDTTKVGEMQINYFVSTSDVPLTQDGISNGSLVGNGILETFPYPTVPFEQNTTRLWHPVYTLADGEYIQIEITMNDDQMTTVTPVPDAGLPTSFTGPTFEDFELHAMVIHAQPTASRLQ